VRSQRKKGAKKRNVNDFKIFAVELLFKKMIWFKFSNLLIFHQKEVEVKKMRLITTSHLQAHEVILGKVSFC
jgi:hypothetical protein